MGDQWHIDYGLGYDNLYPKPYAANGRTMMKKVVAYDRGLVSNKRALILGVVLGVVFGVTKWNAGADYATAASVIFTISFVIGVWLGYYEQKLLVRFFSWWSGIINRRSERVLTRVLELFPELADKIGGDDAPPRSKSMVQHGFPLIYICLNSMTLSALMFVLWIQIDPDYAKLLVFVPLFWGAIASVLIGAQVAYWGYSHWRITVVGKRWARIGSSADRSIRELTESTERIDETTRETMISVWLRKIGLDDGTAPTWLRSTD